MNAQRKIPFQNMQGESWVKLGLAALILFYAMYLILEVILRTMCGQLGIDYCDYVGAGSVANQYGYREIYDLRLLDQAEKSFLPPTADPSTIPVDTFPYLPVFVLPFQALALLPPEISFWIWTAVKLAALIRYLRFFARSLNLQARPVPFLLLTFACLPVFQNIFSGQADVWLTISVAEFMRALINRKPFRAGLWLGGLLLKPQTLILIGLFLLLQRSMRVLAGLAVTALVLVLASVVLIGPQGFLDVAGLWLLYVKGHPSNLVEGMMNWRMLGLQISNLTSPWIGYGVAGAGTLATLLLTYLAWRRPIDLSSPNFVRALLGILAATTLVAWHSHIFMAMILIPPLMYLYAVGTLPVKVLSRWVFLPAILFFVSVFVPEGMMKLNLDSSHIATTIYVLLGMSQFAVNCYVFWWAARPSIHSGSTRLWQSHASPAAE